MSDVEPGPRRRRTRGQRARQAGVTIEEVARKAEVSVATVSRALRGLPNVAPATRARVEAVATELGYHAHTTASRLASGRHDTVGLAVPHINRWFFAEVATGVETVLAEAGLDVLLFAVGDLDRRARLLAERSPIRRRLDGLIMIDLLVDDDEARRLAAEQAFVVTVGQRTGEFPSVTIDNRRATALATRHLLGLGHRRIGLIGAPERSPLHFQVPTDRRAGYGDAMRDAGLEPRADLEAHGGWSVDGGTDAMYQLMTAADPPTAVVALSDEMAMGALKALSDLGLDVPGDVSVIGFDDHDLAHVMRLTTIAQDPQWQGASAGRLLLGLADDPPPESHHVVGDTRLVVRGTTGPARR